MAVCTKCGSYISDGSKFCGNCGMPQRDGMYEPYQKDVDNNSGDSGDFPHTENQNRDQAFESAYREVKKKKAKKAGKKLVGKAVLILIAALILFFLFYEPSGWSEEDARNATQAYLDYLFKGDEGYFEKYAKGEYTEETLAKNRKDRKDTMASSQFNRQVPVTDELKERYAEYYFDLMSKARYTVGEAVKTKEGFEVSVLIEPIISLSKGEYVLLDIQPDEISNAELNERIYTRELELMSELTEYPSYGESEEFVMHITKKEDGEYDFSKGDYEEMAQYYFIQDRHWSLERAEAAFDALIEGFLKGNYGELAKWMVATEEEFKDGFDALYSEETLQKRLDEIGAEILDDADGIGGYSASESVVKKAAEATRSLIRDAKYEVINVEGDGNEFVADIRITPFMIDDVTDIVMEQLGKETESFSEIEEFIDRYFELRAEYILDRVENGRFAESYDRTLHLNFDENKLYQPDYDDLWKILDTIEETESN